MKYLIIFTTILCFAFLPNRSDAQSYTPCLKLYVLDDSTFVNPDSVMIDTCDTREDVDDTEKMWGKHTFDVVLHYNIIPRNYVTVNDSIIEYSIQDILPIYTKAIEEFQNLESKFGSFIFRDVATTSPDTTKAWSRELLIRFDNYVHILEVIDSLHSMSCVSSCGFTLYPSIFVTVNEEKNKVTVYPNPADETLTLEGIGDASASTIKLFNSLGDEIYANVSGRSENKIVLNTSGLAPGYYQIQINKSFYSFIVSR